MDEIEIPCTNHERRQKVFSADTSSSSFFFFLFILKIQNKFFLILNAKSIPGSPLCLHSQNPNQDFSISDFQQSSFRNIFVGEPFGCVYIYLAVCKPKMNLNDLIQLMNTAQKQEHPFGPLCKINFNTGMQA